MEPLEPAATEHTSSSSSQESSLQSNEIDSAEKDRRCLDSTISELSKSESEQKEKENKSNEPTLPTTGTSKGFTDGQIGEPPKKKLKYDSDSSWFDSSSENGSKFLDEFDSDEYAFSIEDDNAELTNRLKMAERRVRELEKALTQRNPVVEIANIRFENPQHTRTVLGLPVLELARVPAESLNPRNPGDEELQFEEDAMFDNELELASVLETDENPIENEDSSSSPEDPDIDGLGLPGQRTSETHNTKDPMDQDFADGEYELSEQCSSEFDYEYDETKISSSRKRKLDSSDSEHSERDEWLCIKCKAKSLPHFSYCLHCFRIRRNWLPERPKSRRLKMRKHQLSLESTQYDVKTESEDHVDEPDQFQLAPSKFAVNLNQAFLVDENNPPLNRLDPSSLPGSITLDLLTPPPSNPNSQDLPVELPTINPNKVTTTSMKDKNSLSDTAYVSKSLEKISSNNICTLCYSREKNAAFVHNKIAHHFACYSCADKLLKTNGKCPICRRRVLRVVKIVSV